MSEATKIVMLTVIVTAVIGLGIGIAVLTA